MNRGPFDWRIRRAIVTGTGPGTRQAIAVALAEAGADIAQKGTQ